MAGQLASLPLSIQLDSNARPIAGGLLYVYDAGTSTPNVFYEDFNTTVVLSWPLVCDAAGRIPMFWVNDGSYRVRFTDASGADIFDINSITAVGPSSGVTGGGTSIGTDQIFQTGDILWQPIDGVRAGWVRGNARTIGSSSSGSSERANADCQDLFIWFWTNFSNAICPVSGGRGGTALADWNANKQISTVDMRGRLAFGMDTMGNVAAGVNTGATSAAVALGAQSITLAQANLPSVAFTVTGTAASHTHGAGTFALGASLSGAGSNTSIQEGAGTTHTNMREGVSTVAAAVGGTSGASGTLALTATAASGGSGTSVGTLSPGRAGSWFFKL